MRRIKQENYFPIITFVHFGFWIIDLSLYSGDYEYNASHVIGEVFSSWVITVFAVNFLMSTKARWLEKMFGGLDKMYMIHRRSGVIAVILLILHFMVIPKELEFKIGVPIGFFAMILIFTGVILSAVPFFKRVLKYDKWINIHKLMGVFYIMGIAHSHNVTSLTAELPIVRTYVLLASIVGVLAWFYKAFLFNFFNKKLEYKIDNVVNFKNDTTELTLKATSKQLEFEAGQFAFLSIDGFNKNEAHPFTISNHPKEDTLRFTIKSLGDYTASLQTAIKKGTKATVQGPNGVFNFKNSTYKKQLWLAGGIGITPFLSFLREVDSSFDITLVWSVRNIEDASYKDEIEKITSKNKNIKFIIWDSSDKGHFAISKMYNVHTIKEHSVYICGAEAMRENYIKGLSQKGVEIGNIHYEEFSFR